MIYNPTLIYPPLPTFVPRYVPSNQDLRTPFGHAAFIHDLVHATRPSLLVEATIETGVSYFSMCQTILEAGLPAISYGALSDSCTALDAERLHAYNGAHYAQFSYLLDQPPVFAPASIDLLHITDVKAFANWRGRMRAGGIVLISGIVAHPSEWQGVEHDYAEHFAFHHADGLGVIRIPGGGTPVDFPFQAMGASAEYLRRHYIIYNGYLERTLRVGLETQALEAKLDEMLAEIKAAEHERIVLDVELRQTQFDRADAKRTATHLELTVDSLRQQLAYARSELQRLEQALQSERSLVSAVVTSASWKLTAPLRKIAAFARRHRR